MDTQKEILLVLLIFCSSSSFQLVFGTLSLGGHSPESRAKETFSPHSQHLERGLGCGLSIPEQLLSKMTDTKRMRFKDG